MYQENLTTRDLQLFAQAKPNNQIIYENKRSLKQALNDHVTAWCIDRKLDTSEFN